jgi:hypothetical protein
MQVTVADDFTVTYYKTFKVKQQRLAAAWEPLLSSNFRQADTCADITCLAGGEEQEGQ